MKIDIKNIDKIIKLNREGYLQKEICDILNCCEESLRLFCINNNLKLIRNHKLKKNQYFFDNIDSEIKAYLLGFFIADGCICIDKKPRSTGIVDVVISRMAITLTENDCIVLEWFKNNISPTSKIKYFQNIKGAKNRKPQGSLRFSSKYMADMLMHRYNIYQRKTEDVLFRFPFENIPKELYRHFIRGFFDGDGWCSNRRAGFCSTSKIFLEQIREILITSINISFKKIYSYNSKNSIIYTLDLNMRDSKLIYDWFYNDSNYYLLRKKEKFNMDNTEVISRPEIP